MTFPYLHLIGAVDSELNPCHTVLPGTSVGLSQRTTYFASLLNIDRFRSAELSVGKSNVWGKGPNFPVRSVKVKYIWRLSEIYLAVTQCRRGSCGLLQNNGQFAASWKKGSRHISVVDVSDGAEINNLVV